MSGFDDVIERGSSRVKSDTESFRPRKEVKHDPPSSTSILELIEGLNIDGISNNMNPEIKEKVLIPLAGLLDKYGIADSIGESNTAQAGMGLFSLLGDVAPVIKGLAEYISGQRNNLKAEDKEFLERLKNNEMDGDFSDLFVSESKDETPPPAPAPVLGPNGENLSSINMNLNEVDWWAVMGVQNPEERRIRQMPEARRTYMAKDANKKLPSFGSAGEKPVIVGLPTLDDLAAEIGMKSEDLNNPTNNDNQSENTNEAIGEHLESVDFSTHESDSLIGDMDMDAIYSIDFESDDDSFEEISEEEN